MSDRHFETCLCFLHQGELESLRAEAEKYKEWAGKVIEDHRLLFVETERLRKALKSIYEADNSHCSCYRKAREALEKVAGCQDCNTCRKLAREALEEK